MRFKVKRTLFSLLIILILVLFKLLVNINISSASLFKQNRNTQKDPRHLLFTEGKLKPVSNLWSPDFGSFPKSLPYDRIFAQINYSIQLNQYAAASSIIGKNSSQDLKLQKKIIFVNITKSYLFQFQEIERALIARSENCPFLPCIITRNARFKLKADVIFESIYGTQPQAPNLNTKAKRQDQIKILYTIEPPHLTTFPNYEPSDVRKIWTATYRLDSDLPTPYGIWKYYNDSIRQAHQEINYADGKKYLVAAFISNCQSTNGREKIIKRLSKIIPIHIYGSCYNPDQKRYNCTRGHPECFLKVARNYKFIIAFENSDCRGYLTEKIFFNALRHNSIPIVMGASPADYKLLVPENSYIHVNDFRSSSALVQHLKYLNKHDAEYNKYFMWKGTGQFYLWTDHFFCRVCAMLYYNDYYPRSMYPLNLSRWWLNFGIGDERKKICLKRNEVWD